MKKVFLLIDDDADDRMLFCEALAELRNEVTCIAISNGNIALSEILEERLPHPDLVFIDINMPGKDGWYYLNKIKHNPGLKGIPVIMYSTAIDEFIVEESVSKEVLFLFKKPDDFEDLKRCLSTLYYHVINGTLHHLTLNAVPWFYGIQQ